LKISFLPKGLKKLEDLVVGMKLDGVVTNITAFGAFVDIGVHQDGLVHISEMADRFVKSPGDVVKVSQKVKVTILAVDAERKRISLSMKKSPGEKPAADKNNPADASKAGEQKIKKGKPQRRDNKKQGQGKAAPKPFNNPFADAFRRSKRGSE